MPNVPHAGDHLLQQHGFHLRGDAGHADQHATVVPDQQAGRRAARIVQYLASRGNHRLLLIVLRHGHPPVSKPLFDGGENLWVEPQRTIHDGRQDVAGQIVLGWPQSAGHETSARDMARRMASSIRLNCCRPCSVVDVDACLG
jgi:hypothetical protein